MSKVEVSTLRMIWVTVELDVDEEDLSNREYLIEEATSELLDAIQVTRANSGISFELESLDAVEILPQN